MLGFSKSILDPTPFLRYTNIVGTNDDNTLYLEYEQASDSWKQLQFGYNKLDFDL